MADSATNLTPFDVGLQIDPDALRPAFFQDDIYVNWGTRLSDVDQSFGRIGFDTVTGPTPFFRIESTRSGAGVFRPLTFWTSDLRRADISTTGQFQLVNQGSAFSPAYTFISDTDTGINNVVPNIMNFITAGVERARFTAIGQYLFNTTTAPASALTRWHITTNDISGERFRFDSVDPVLDNTYLDIVPFITGAGPRIHFVQATRTTTISVAQSAGNVTFDITGSESLVTGSLTGVALASWQLNSALNGAGESVLRCRYLTFGVNIDTVIHSVDAGGQVGTESVHDFSIITSDVVRALVVANGTTWTFTQGAATSGNPTFLTYTAAAHTTLAALSFDETHFNYNRSVQFTTGAVVAEARTLRISPVTWTATAATQTITNAYTLVLFGAPAAGLNVAITNSYALGILAGAVGAGTTNSFGLLVNAQTGATNNYAAVFLGGNVGIGAVPGAFTLDVTGTARVTGKLTVGGAIDPTSILLSGGTALFFESNNGDTAPLSGAATGRLRYNNTTGTWQVSVQGGAYTNIGTAVTGGGWTDDGTIVRLTTATDAVTIGAAVQVGAERLRITGGTSLVDFTSTTALQVAQTGGGGVTLSIDTTNIRVGINEVAPASPLHITDNNALGLRLQRTAATARIYELRVGTTGILDWVDQTVAAVRMRLDTSGNVIIGTGTSLGLLRVQGNTVIDNTSTTAFRVFTTGGAGTPIFTVDASNFRVGVNISPGAALDVTQTASLSGNPIAVRFSGGAHTGLTAGANVISVDFRLDQTIQHATGAVALEETIRFSAPTYSFVAASTITECAFLSVTGSPTAGTNATITTAMALWIKAGGTGSFNTYFGATPSLGSGIGVIGISNAGTNPTVNPVGGGIMYVTGGGGTWRGSGGTVTTFGPAGPHCATCGYDMWEVAAINTRWKAWRFVCGSCGERYEGGPKNVLNELDWRQKNEIISKDTTWEEISRLLGVAA